MNVYDIIRKYLEENGYDGLVAKEYECGCVLDDLFPCDGEMNNCEAAYKWPGDKEAPFYMKTTKPEQDNTPLEPTSEGRVESK